MTEQEAFLKQLAEDENDTATRLVYADWLDDHGEHEEADRQRKWPMAKEWLTDICGEISRSEETSYSKLVELGREIAQQSAIPQPAAPGSSAPDRLYFHNEAMWRVLKAHRQTFWQHWSVVTGIPLPASLAARDFHHWRCCDHEIYYWFGLPDDDPEE